MKALKKYMRGGRGEVLLPLKGNYFRSTYFGFGKILTSNTSVQKYVDKKIRHLSIAHVAFYGTNDIGISFESTEWCTAKINILNNHKGFKGLKFVPFYSKSNSDQSINLYILIRLRLTSNFRSSSKFHQIIKDSYNSLHNLPLTRVYREKQIRQSA